MRGELRRESPFLLANSGGFNGLYNVLHFGSAHAAGIQSVFVDGAVHLIGFDVDVAVFSGLASRDGDEPIPADAIR